MDPKILNQVRNEGKSFLHGFVLKNNLNDMFIVVQFGDDDLFIFNF